MNNIKVSVIISTYNSVNWLEKVIWGYNNQSFSDFEMIIADDGSTSETSDLIEVLSKKVTFPINHIWHEDNGFQKSKILNKAILACKTDYIIMSDGDCIPRNDFVEIHYTYKRKGYFLSGGYHMLPMYTSSVITKKEIENGQCFDLKWLKSNGLKSSFKNLKLTVNRRLAKFLNLVTPTNASWNGHNVSGWKENIKAVNGFDERMQYGGQDRELGERLMNFGIKGLQIRYFAICVHLDHPRGYKTKESINRNLKIRSLTKTEKRVWTAFGIKKS